MLIFSYFCFANSTDPEKIINDVKKKFEEVKDYRVDVTIKVDVDFLKVPESKAKLLYKSPDKIKIKSEGFAMLPKEGMNFSPMTIFSGEYTSIYEKDENLNGYNTAVIKIIPLGREKDVILSTLWVDINKKMIRKVESTTKTKGTFTINLIYNNNESKYPLPNEMIFDFEIGRANITELLDKKKSDNSDRSNENKNKKNKVKKGTVRILYSNYSVNKGIDDKEFEENTKK